ncbi:uncharacterized protein LOC105803278 isoform X2 [Gossypium raimondii]|uniref:Phosphoglycolate phosphatase n=2 Tax=Gossypium raimondii TaxID=29730 RepID=A0A0D2SDS7_GOSRA|nr:uncharacterized protein LOC105803278 isoform X2 [Gossypium raimondii]KJB42438.1 hypothetical protein B456_007G153400 [Gossypium raimondii]KJB42439.1 hypothetical protein B456_007G153400 [Gossypium raimondii]
MAEYVASPSCIKLHLHPSFLRQRGFVNRNSNFRTPLSKFSYGSCKVLWLSTWRKWKVDNPFFSNLKVSPCFMETPLRSTSVGSLVDSDSITASDWVTFGDQLLLMTGIFLTYVAGVVPVQKSSSTSPKSIADNDSFPQGSTSSGSARTNSDQNNLKPVWDVVRGKILDSLDVIESENDFRNVVFDEQQRAKRPLSLYALSEGPKIRLLWASLQQLEEEVKNNVVTSDTGNIDDWLIAFSRIIQNSCKPACFAWLKKELGLQSNNMELVSLITEKLNGDNTVLQNITKSGKKNLYAELLYFLRFGSLRKGCCYDQSLFTLYGDSILEDLVITIADGIASTYLDLISVDGNLSDEVNDLGLAICNLSTRALQRLRNEVALNQWLYQNLEAIVSMYEDRFDLYTLKSQLIEEKSSDYAETSSWWKKLMLRENESVLTSLQYVVISHFSMSVKRTKELRALVGWRYYFSLFLEFSDISLPMVRVVIDKVSNAISFFLVCLIGRSLGLIYTGIRQSLRWK